MGIPRGGLLSSVLCRARERWGRGVCSHIEGGAGARLFAWRMPKAALTVRSPASYACVLDLGTRSRGALFDPQVFQHPSPLEDTTVRVMGRTRHARAVGSASPLSFFGLATRIISAHADCTSIAPS